MRLSCACVRSGQAARGSRGMKLHADDPPPAVAVPVARPTGLAAPGLLSISDVCLALQCGRTFVYELLQRGELRAIKLGRLTRISRKELDAFLEGKERGAAGLPGTTFGVSDSAGRAALNAVEQPCLPDPVGSVSTHRAGIEAQRQSLAARGARFRR